MRDDFRARSPQRSISLDEARDALYAIRQNTAKSGAYENARKAWESVPSGGKRKLDDILVDYAQNRGRFFGERRIRRELGRHATKDWTQKILSAFDGILDGAEPRIAMSEAKPWRRVGFDEVAAILIDKSAEAEMRPALEKAGVKNVVAVDMAVDHCLRAVLLK